MPIQGVLLNAFSLYISWLFIALAESSKRALVETP
jgi:hypothetical protein